MAKIGGFTELLQKLKIIQIEQDDEQEQPERRERAAYKAGPTPSVYESAYSRSRGREESARAENRSGASRFGFASRKQSAPRGQALARKQDSAPVRRPDTVVYYISSLNECAAVIKDIIAGVSAVINFDGTDDRTSQRIIDTLAGAAFALNAKVRKITDSTYLIAPKNVNVNMSRHIERRY